MNRDNLIKSLARCTFDGIIEGPKGDLNHHIQSVDIIQGQDDYKITSIAHVASDKLALDKVEIPAPNRPRAMGGVVITIWSEEFYLWSRQILFHKGCIYQSDTILEENVDLYAEQAKQVEDDPQLSLDLQ